MKKIPPIPKYLDHLGLPIDVYHVLQSVLLQGGIINPKSGESFSPKVTPDLFYLRFHNEN